MAKSAPSSDRGSVPLPVAIGVIVVVVAAIGLLGWKLFAPPPDPAAGMSAEQKNAEIQRRVQETGQKVLMDQLTGNQKPGLSGATK